MTPLEKDPPVAKSDSDIAGAKEDVNELKEEIKKASDWILVIAALVIIILIAAIFSFKLLSKKEVPKTIDDLHLLNLDGKLEPDQGYMYNGYSFVFANGLWYTQVQTASASSIFDIPLHYSPKLLEDVSVEGEFDSDFFNSHKGIYITFNPLGQDLNYVALAVGEFDQSIIKSFNKIPIAACDRNETAACSGIPIITCNSTDKPVLYLQQKEGAKVIYDKNCIIVQGIREDIVRSTNRLLLKLYGIMP
ncbi:hypothetical protein KY358_00060 [Candidatus Woesearchaeota archaeon]|nr:hypothetical protein [Candidatus Woesearchaeota archaeon]